MTEKIRIGDIVEYFRSDEFFYGIVKKVNLKSCVITGLKLHYSKVKHGQIRYNKRGRGSWTGCYKIFTLDPIQRIDVSQKVSIENVKIIDPGKEEIYGEELNCHVVSVLNYN